MALGVDVDKPSKKYGAAADLKFGCPENDDFDILESVSANSNFGTNVQVKNEVGNTVGSVIGDPKVDLTMNGMGKTAPKALGAVTELACFVTAVGDDAPPTNAENLKFCIVGVKQDNSNEDFMKFEVTAEHYYNVNYDQSEDLTTGANEFS